ncbi:prefoldin subunit 2 [Kwoniella heveanensis CBS 569]|nr:prefoldin subunit 2 [Kwoniella heveanensis CBS 569]
MPPKPAQQKPNPQEVPMIFQRYRTELQNLAQKIGEIESEMDEHALVLSTLKPLATSDPQRTCYRLIGGTLVKRNVTDVVPSLETNYNGIKEVLDGLVKSYKAKEGEFEKWREEMGVQMPR